jgi:hypothetical protein
MFLAVALTATACAGTARAAEWAENFERAAPGSELPGGAATVVDSSPAEGSRCARFTRPTAPKPPSECGNGPNDLPAPRSLDFPLPVFTAETVWFQGSFRVEKASVGAAVSLVDADGTGPTFGLSVPPSPGLAALVGGEEFRPFGCHLSDARIVPGRGLTRWSQWVRLAVRVDRKARRFSVWCDGRQVLSDLAFAEGPKEKDAGDGTKAGGGPWAPVRLRLSPARVAGAVGGDVFVDSLRVGETAPEGLATGRDYPEGKGRRLRFAVFGDPQLGFGGIEESVVAFRQGIHEANAGGVDFTLVAGDLIHEKTGPVVDERFGQYLECAKGFAKPSHPIPGNHDPEPAYRKYIRPDLDYTFAAAGLRFIGYQDADVNRVGGVLPAERAAWLKERLAEARKAGETVVMFTHIPPFGPLLARDRIGPGVDELRVLHREFRPVVTFSGHMHRGPATYDDKATSGGGTVLVAPGLGFDYTDRRGWLLVDVYEDRLEVFVKPLWRPTVDKESADSTWPGPTRLPLKRE